MFVLMIGVPIGIIWCLWGFVAALFFGDLDDDEDQARRSVPPSRALIVAT